ncbi:MAG: glutamyl-tRNA reductase [Deltaproteobacteria bacterium]|nr:glutamyl-tRNA reductase [Deltaproteobacteria bacterium]
MRQLGMVGLTFRQAGQSGLEFYTFSPDEIDTRHRHLHEHCGFVESVYLATCNRVEIVFVGDAATSVAEYRQRIFGYFHPEAGEADWSARRILHAYGGEGAAERLFCVAAALDSMNPGDAQILGQVKSAYQRSCAANLVGKRLALIFEEAVRAAKRVRTETSLGNGSLSMFSLALEVIEERLEPEGGRIVVIGVGDMSRQCGEVFSQREGVELLFVNRTPQRAESLAREYGGRAMALADFLERPESADVIVTATGASAPILGAEFFEALPSRSTLVVDLAVPRDTDCEAARRAGIDLCDIDGLEVLAARNRRRRESVVAEARQLLDDSLAELRRCVVERDMGPVVRAVRAHYADAARENLDQLFEAANGELSAEARGRIERWARTFANRCVHVPTVGLKRLAHEHGMEAVETFLVAFGDDFSEASEDGDG